MNMAGQNVVRAGMASSTSMYKSGTPLKDQRFNRNSLAKAWQIEAYRQIDICGEARYAVTLFANMAARAEIGVSEPQALAGKAVWVTSGPEFDAFSELAPTVRDRQKLIKSFTMHYTIAGESYLIARERLEIDPPGPDPMIWEFVAVTELQRMGPVWRIRHENKQWLELKPTDPVIRMWNADPSERQEAWSPFRSMADTLTEIEWLTKHIFTQVKSRLMSAGVWFLPNNLTFPPPPPEAINGDYEETIASMNEAELFMVSLAASSTASLADTDVAFPSVVLADAESLAAIDQTRLIQFWSTIDDKAMILRADAIKRFALGMDLPPEQVLGSSGRAVPGSGAGTGGSVNHWGVWANEEQTITAHIEPALSDLCAALTSSFLANAVKGGTDKVIGFSTTSLRLKQDRSKEALELWDRGLIKGEVALREIGFDPANDAMGSAEFKQWLLRKIAGGSATPEQVQAAVQLLGVVLPTIEPPAVSGNPAPVQKALPPGTPVPVAPAEPAPGKPGAGQPPSLKDHPTPKGPPQGTHDHTPAPYSLVHVSEGLVLRALEKAGNRLLNDGKRGRDKDRSTLAHEAHCVVEPTEGVSFDFSMASTVFSDLSPARAREIVTKLEAFCDTLYSTRQPYSRNALIEMMANGL
jgi:hypothetical protein